MNDTYGSSKGFIITGLVAFVALVLLVGGCNYMSSFDAPRKGYAAVCQTGGPIEGDSGTCGYFAPGSGKKMIGYENKLVEFPASNRFWRAGGDNADVKPLGLPTSNGGSVGIFYLMRFKLPTDEKRMLDFYKKHATRTYGGPKAEENPDGWWESWLLSQVNPIIEKRLREEVAPYSCAELNPQCDLNRLNDVLDQLATGKATKIEDAQKKTGQDGKESVTRLNQIAQAVEEKLAGAEGEFAKSLEGEFLIDIDFQIVKANPPTALTDEIEKANAAVATLVKANADARANVAKAKGVADARREEARGIRDLNAARKTGGKAVIAIEVAKALCGESGCTELRSLGGDSLGINLNDLNSGSGG